MKALVLILDSLPLSFLGCYGNDWIDTPALDRVAAEGVIFDRHYSDCPQPEAANRAWMTGRYALPPLEAITSLDQSQPDLFSRLRSAGVSTLELRNRPAPEPEEILASLPAAERWLAWIEAPLLHPPWDVPEELFQRYFEMDSTAEASTPVQEPITPADDIGFLRLQSTYGALVAALDEWVQELLERLPLDDLLLLITTDRGMPLGEHGVVGYDRPWLHSELVHLPLLVRWPGGAEAGRRVHALTQPVDLMPTLLAAFDLPAEGVHGYNLLPFLHGEPEPVRNYAFSGLRIGAALEYAVRTPEWSFLLPLSGRPDEPPRSPQLYVLPDDRWEVNNVIQHHPEGAEELERLLRAFARAPGRAADSAHTTETGGR